MNVNSRVEAGRGGGEGGEGRVEGGEGGEGGEERGKKEGRSRIEEEREG